jgi:hypothetical protein
VRYATARFRLSTAADVGIRAAIIGFRPEHPRAGIAQAIENDQLIVSLTGYGEAPPTEHEPFVAYARSLAQPDIAVWIEGAELLGRIETQNVPVTYRRHYDQLRTLPDGLVAVGDAVCAFNPVYAQGMSVAAVEASLLADCLADGRQRLGQRFFQAIAPVTAVPWQMGAGSDLTVASVAGKRSRVGKVLSAWIRRVQLAASRDAAVAEQFIRVACLLDPPSALLSPRFAWRVLIGSGTGLEPGARHGWGPSAA